MTNLIIGLDSWVIQDGNYGDFAQATRVSFALEFYPVVPLPKCGRFDRKVGSLQNIADSSYQLLARLCTQMMIGGYWTPAFSCIATESLLTMFAWTSGWKD